MAGDWIKMRTDLRDDPAVIGIAARLGLDEDAVVGKLHRVWSWANRQTTDGNAPSVTKTWLDRYIGVTGWSDAMEKEGWLDFQTGSLVIPKFDRHNGKSAKERALGKARIDKYRNAPTVTKALLEKRREEKRRIEETPLPPSGENLPEKLRTEAFKIAWAEWITYRSQARIKPYTPIGTQKQLSRLEKMGHDNAIAAIEHSIASGYHGIYEPSKNQKTANRRGDEASERRAARSARDFAEPEQPMPFLDFDAKEGPAASAIAPEGEHSAPSPSAQQGVRGQ